MRTLSQALNRFQAESVSETAEIGVKDHFADLRISDGDTFVRRVVLRSANAAGLIQRLKEMGLTVCPSERTTNASMGEQPAAKIRL